MTQHASPPQLAPSKIRVRGLRKSFGTKQVLDGLDLDVAAGESFVIIGGSGRGKSVLLKCILGLMAYDSGEILIDGVDIHKISKGERSKIQSTFGMLFQGGALFDSLPVWQNVAFQLLNQGMPKVKAKELALMKLTEVNLDEKVAHAFPAELSGGMQKRVSLARAIANQPQVIFFDEPTTGLDPIVSGTINQLIKKTIQQLGASALTITHDMASLRKIADRVGLLHQGKLIWVGTVPEMDATDNPYVQQFIRGLPEGPFRV
jgi:phospholipid/cholesterol/gamma-HCH transport system ATP-binding protein